MKKWLIPVIVIGVILYALYSWGKGFNNEAVVLQEDAKTKWSNVESAYQRRSDLIGNLISTVKNAAEYEKGTLTAVIEARAKATSTNIDANNLTPEMMAQFQQAQSGLAGAMSKLMVVVEKYPELQANKNFLELQSQLEGTENRIKMERDRFNSDVNKYNKHIKVFPNTILAGWFNFDEMSRFQSNPGAENAIDVGEKFKE
jgi:LemA protein